MFTIRQIWKKIETSYYKIRQKKQALFLKQLGIPTRNRSKIKPRFKMTLLFLLSFIFIFSFQQFYSQFTPTKEKRLATTPQSIKFMGALVSEQKAIALVNEKPMQVGDELYGLRIVAIDENKLDLKGPKGLVRMGVGATYRV